MIFVTLGTQDKTFERLLKAVDKQITAGNIQETVIVQAGKTQYTSKQMELYDFVDEAKLNEWISTSRLIITHGGVGTIITALMQNKKIIAAARLAKYGEHTNDHQMQIIENFSKAGYLLALDDFDHLNDVLKKAEAFEPEAFQSNTEQMIHLVREKIEK